MEQLEQEVRRLYQQLLDGWNRRSAAEMAALFTENGSIVGFDGSQMDGRAEIEATLAPIFADHPTASYVSKVRELRQLAPNVVLLRAVVGMLPPGKKEINPATNAIQSLVTVKEGEHWRIALFHNTPAAFHGRPHLVEEMTTELQALVT
jgi:uncharacterized protein (TIGR02246 family)